MRVLLIGQGGREHAIARALVESAEPGAVELTCAPGNPGIAQLARCVPIASDDLPGLLALAADEAFSLVLPGPEAPLVAGLVDRLHALHKPGLFVCGPSQAAAQIEASKLHTRTLCDRLAIPGPRYRTCGPGTSPRQILAALDELRTPQGDLPVLKADGLCGGKGTFLLADRAALFATCQQLLAGALGPAGRRLVLEERLFGTEASVFYACHGTQAVRLPDALDYKQLLDGGAGPNTGGMGAISPHPTLTPADYAQIEAQFVAPLLAHLAAVGTPYCGFLYLGLMLTPTGPRLLEFNCRLGDPEAQVLLPRLPAGALLPLAHATAVGDLAHVRLDFSPNATCAVVACAPGYPTAPAQGLRIPPLPAAALLPSPDEWFLIAGLTQAPEGDWLTTGGRVLSSVARHPDPTRACHRAYVRLAQLGLPFLHHRTDIGRAASTAAPAAPARSDPPAAPPPQRLSRR